MESPRQSESDQVEYWKKQAKYFEQKSNDIQQELDEYTENSAQLEKELEASLVQVEKQNRDLDNQNQRLKNEIEMLRNKLERSQQETSALENELQALKIDKDNQAAYIRELEQKNDDLERGQRVISESVSCIEALLNQAYERNAVLESEVDEIENLRVSLQRATDEARDLKQELKVVEKIPHKKEDEGGNDNSILNGHVSNTSRNSLDSAQTTVTSPQKREVNGNTMTPSSRVTAINIVGDLLRKVGLERFLCRECGKVKCSCAAAAAVEAASTPPPPQPENDAKYASTNGIGHEMQSDPIEYRKPQLTLQHSGSDGRWARRPPVPPAPPAPRRASAQPFARSAGTSAGAGEPGRLRRSFAVRSREGLENLLTFGSIRKGHDPNKTKQPMRQ